MWEKKKASEINEQMNPNKKLKKNKKVFDVETKANLKVWQEKYSWFLTIHHSSKSTHYGGQIAPLVIYIFHVFYLDYCYRCINVLVYRDIFTFLSFM